MTTTTTTPPPSPPTPMEKHRKALQAQSIRCLRNHSAASLRSSLDGQELGCEKLKALVEKFKLTVENDDKVEETATTSDSDSSTTEEEGETSPAKAAAPAVSTTIATNEQVRSKLLNRLGIQSTAVVQQPEANPRRAADIPRQPSFELPLNDAGDFENWESRKLVKQQQQNRNPFSFFGQNNNNDKKSDDAVSNVTDSVHSSVSAGGEAKENNETLQETTTAAVAETTTSDNDKTDTVEDQQDAAPPPPKRVHFHATVKAHPIPSHTVYSKRIKSTIWSSAQELEENVARNCYEFEAENWSFEDVVDEDEMIWYHGQWVHPVHFVDFSLDSSTGRKKSLSTKANSEAAEKQ